MLNDKQERDAFNSWFYASKYAQIVPPTKAHEQAAWDGWKAARAALAAAPVQAVSNDVKEQEIGRRAEQNGPGGDAAVLLGARAPAYLAGAPDSALADALWNSDAVMSLNAELGLPMHRLVQLMRAMLAAVPCRATGAGCAAAPQVPAGYLKQCVNELRHLLPPHELKAAAPGAPQTAEPE